MIFLANRWAGMDLSDSISVANRPNRLQFSGILFGSARLIDHSVKPYLRLLVPLPKLPPAGRGLSDFENHTIQENDHGSYYPRVT